MKKPIFSFLVSLLFFVSDGSKLLAQYPSQNITLLSHWDTSITVAEPIFHIRFNSPWGWVDPQDNKEYAILGASNGTYIIDVTIPAAPLVRDFVPGRRDSCVWREFKTYQNYLYAVSDDGVDPTNQNSMQIIDLSPLPDSVHVVYDQDTLVQRSHSIFIDELNTTMYLNSVYLPNYGGHSNMAVFSLANPVAPVLLRRLEQDFPSNDNVHDCYVRNDTCYASSCFSGLFMYKFNSNNTFSQIGSLTNYVNYGQGYNHSSALTADSKTLIFTDEVPANLAVKSLDVSDFSNLTVLDTFRSTPTTGATPHNPFIRAGDNTRVVVGYYQDGVQIFDITNPSTITRTGFFDTAPANCPTCPNPNYSGCWGVYIDLPSGIILASDMQDGLFILDATSAMGVSSTPPYENSVDVFPNPFSSDFQIGISLISGEKISYTLTDITGKTIFDKQTNAPSGNSVLYVDGKSLSAGTYLLIIKGEDVSLTKKIIKINK